MFVCVCSCGGRAGKLRIDARVFLRSEAEPGGRNISFLKGIPNERLTQIFLV